MSVKQRFIFFNSSTPLLPIDKLPVLTAKANSVLIYKKFIKQNLMKINFIMSIFENYGAFFRAIQNDSREHEFALSVIMKKNYLWIINDYGKEFELFPDIEHHRSQSTQFLIFWAILL